MNWFAMPTPQERNVARTRAHNARRKVDPELRAYENAKARERYAKRKLRDVCSEPLTTAGQRGAHLSAVT